MWAAEGKMTVPEAGGINGAISTHSFPQKGFAGSQ